MFKIILLAIASLTLFSCLTAPVPAKPIRALLLTGGCCHDYKAQAKVIQKFTSDKINISWDVINEGGKGSNHKFAIYSEKDWAKRYDVVVHNECFARTNDDKFIKKIVADHLEAGVGVIVVHCAMHTFRDGKEGTDEWCKLIGLKSRTHEHQAEYAVENINATHPIMKGFPQVWQAPVDELYVVSKPGPKMVPLARAFGERTKKFHTCIWTNELEDSKIFGITFGHNTSTMEAKVFQGVFNRGLLWTTGHLTSKGEAEAGYEAKK